VLDLGSILVKEQQISSVIAADTTADAQLSRGRLCSSRRVLIDVIGFEIENLRQERDHLCFHFFRNRSI
jgi:hypothetical protein